jgi:hypothetical protein
MSFWQYLFTLSRRSCKRTRKAVDAVHFYIILIIAIGVIIGWAGFTIHMEEPELIWILVPVFIAVFLFGLLWEAYTFYREEHDRRVARERQLTSERGQTVAKMIAELPDNAKAALKQLAIAERLGGDQIRARFPGVDFTKLSSLTVLLDHVPPPVDVWRFCSDADRDLLRDLLVPNPSDGTTIPRRRFWFARVRSRLRCLRRKWTKLCKHYAASRRIPPF